MMAGHELLQYRFSWSPEARDYFGSSAMFVIVAQIFPLVRVCKAFLRLEQQLLAASRDEIRARSY
jgi:hypothetical protein